MKKMSNILKTSVMVPRWSRVWSRIDSIQPAYTLLALLMVVLFGVNENAWGNADFYSKGRAYADPTGVGKVYVWVDGGYGVSEEEGGWTGQGTSEAYQLAKQNTGKDSSPTHTYTFMADHDNNSTDTLVGYTFRGWYEDAGHTKLKCTTREISPHPSIATSKSEGDAPCLTFYAWWTANNYTVTLNNHGATTAGTTSVSVTYDATTGISSNITVPTKTDYTFDGYYTGENGAGTQRINASGVWQAASGFIEDGKWKNAGNVTLHAKWIANSKTITLDNQGADDGKGGTASIEVFYNRSTNLTEQAVSTLPIKSGYTFEGYFTGTNGSGTKIFDRSGYTVESAADATYTYTDATLNWKYDGNITLYAYWKQNQTITWSQTISSPVRSAVIDLTASASSSLGITYEVTVGSDLVTLSGSTLTCKKAGDVTVVAHQAGNSSWNAAADASKSFTIIEHAITTNPTASGTLTYEQTLNTISPTGGVTNVAGSWAWKYPTSVPVAGTANQVAVFTPSSSIISACPLECNVSVTVNKANPDVTCTVNANTHYVDDTKIDLQSTWTREGDGTVTYTLLSYVESGENNDDGTDPYIESNRYLHLGKAGTAQVKMAIAAGTNYIARNETIEVVINKHDPAFAWNTQTNYYYNTTVNNFLTKTSGASYTVTSSNEEVANMDGANLKIYNKAGTTKIKYVHPQTYKWNEKKDSVTFTPEWKSNHVTLEVTESNYTSVIENHYSGSSDRFRWVNNGVLLGGNNVLTESEGWDSRYIDIHFTGMPDSLSFTYERSVSTSTGMDWWVKEKTEDGEWGNETIYHPSGNPASGTCKVPLKPNTRWVRLRGYCNYGVYFRNIKITKKEYFKTDKSSLDFATNVKDASCDAQTFKFHHASAGYITTVSSSDSHFTVSPTSVTTGGEVCDSAVITVNYLTTDVGEHSGTITISDNIGNSTSVSVAGTTVGAYTPTITWPGATSYLVGSTIANSFVAKDNNEDIISGTWSFESSDSTVIDVVEGELKAICGGTATITGTIAEGATWSSGSQTVSLTVTKPNDVVTWNMPTAEDGTIHIKAKHDVPYSIATANTAIRFTTRNAAQLTVNAGPTIDTLRTVAHSQTPVWLVATTAGSCAYNSIKDSIQITVEPCYHEIIWNQTFAGLTTAEDGTISEEYDLNAYAVDSNGVATNIDIIYSMPSVSFATLEGSHLTISGIGETTITATTDDDSKFATVVYPKTLKVRRYGEECKSNALPESVAQEIAFENIVANTSNPAASTYYLSTPVDSLVYYVRKYAGATTGSFELLGYDFATGEWRAMESGYGPGEVTTNSEGSRRVVHFEASDSTVRILKWESNADIGKIHWTHYQEGSKYILKATAAPLKIFEVNRTSITRGEMNPVMVNTPFDTTITLRYCDKPHINYTYTGSVLSVTTDKEINNDCGDYGTYTFRFRGEFTKTGRYQDTIFFKTSAGDSIAVPFDLHVYTSGEFNFDNTEGDWGTSNKWSYGASTTHGLLPTKSSAVTIEESITISAEVEAYSVKILNDATITILPGGGLTVGAGGIKNSSKTNLILTAGTEGVTKGKTGYLRISPNYTDTMPHAKVQMYSIGYYNMSSSEEDIASWQYIGTPIDFAGKLAKTVFTRSWIYSYQESTNSWVNNRKTLVMQPFVGYSTTQLESESGMMIEYPGQLIANRGVVTIDLEYTDVDHGHNILANSFAAPIDITQFRTSDFINAERAIYIFNTGSKSQADDYSMSSSGDAAGQFRTIAIGSAAEMAERFAADPSIPTTIAPMQGFCVNAQAAGAQFKLDYERLVWNANYKSHAPTALRAPKRNADAAEEEEMPITGSMKMTLEANGLTDNIYLLESERYMTDFEDGYDAHKMESGTLNIFTVENEDKLAIDATNSIIGTRVGVRTGEETAYTITFSYVDGEQEWALYDAETDEMIDITNDNTYTFFAEPNSNITERFMIVESNGAQIPAVTTGNDKVTSDVRAHKFIKDGELFILKNGVLYDVTGARVK